MPYTIAELRFCSLLQVTPMGRIDWKVAATGKRAARFIYFSCNIRVRSAAAGKQLWGGGRERGENGGNVKWR